ncbi:MAG: hypothetical protein PHC61_16425 [Chitinivibrionales bacterium]|nr:hypothetical protein [Chitinivibrionales bacterium]
MAGFLAAVVCLNMAPAAAAMITWGAPAFVAGDNDVSTTGTLKYAYCWNSTNLALNGVTFTGTLSNTAVGSDISITCSSTSGWAGTSDFFFRTPAGIDGNSPYGKFLAGGLFTDYQYTYAMTLKNLTSGHTYMLQIWSCSAYYNGGVTVIKDESGDSVSLIKNKNAATGPGQYGIGTFTANAATQLLNISGTTGGSGDKSVVINGLQVREINGTGVIAINKNIATAADNLQNAGIYDLRGRLVGISENGKLPQGVRAGIYILKSTTISGATAKHCAIK